MDYSFSAKRETPPKEEAELAFWNDRPNPLNTPFPAMGGHIFWAEIFSMAEPACKENHSEGAGNAFGMVLSGE